jgi:hypothetical protein
MQNAKCRMQNAKCQTQDRRGEQKANYAYLGIVRAMVVAYKDRRDFGPQELSAGSDALRGVLIEVNRPGITK